MKISGFTMAKNANSLYYPWKQAILSILPIVDEFVIALGKSDEGDKTEEIIKGIRSDKIKIIETEWDLNKYPNGMENAHQTDIAKDACSGDWLFYLQADEVVHEKYLPTIKKRCEEFVADPKVEGLLFKYKHFWGDYKHHNLGHGWYKNEIRIVRNDKDIHSWESAQSFRRLPNFDGLNYRRQENAYKLHVAEVDAFIYHYGWVRPPHKMQKKRKALDTIHKGQDRVNAIYANKAQEFDYGPMSRLAKFEETHPQVMKEWIHAFDWQDKLHEFPNAQDKLREPHRHEKLNNKIVTFIEQKILGGRELGGFHNYELLQAAKYRL